MPYSDGGATTNLITYYKEGEDGQYPYGKNRYLAQTFTITDTFAIFRIIVKINTRSIWKPHLCAIRGTDGAGVPLNVNIASMGMSEIDELEYGATRWTRTTFRNFPLLPPGVYAIVLYSPEQVDWLQCNWRADKTAPAYALGKAWLSHNAGEDWAEIPNYDFMFEVWGYTPPPAPPPPPSLSNFSVRGVEFQRQPDGIVAVVNTDIPSHLYLRWSTVEPQKHKAPLLRRGLSMHVDVYLCFVAYTDLEQCEPGDTLVHTFRMIPWPDCETRYFHFWATVATVSSVSTTAPFKVHFKAPTWDRLILEPWTT